MAAKEKSFIKQCGSEPDLRMTIMSYFKYILVEILNLEFPLGILHASSVEFSC